MVTGIMASHASSDCAADAALGQNGSGSQQSGGTKDNGDGEFRYNGLHNYGIGI